MKRAPVDQAPVRGDKQPEQIRVGDRWRRIEHIVDHWRERGRWWAGEAPRDFFLVETRRGAFIVSRGPEGWRLEEAID